MYFGLMQAINQYPWRNDAKKAIILVGGYPAGLYRPGTDFVNTYVEPIFNIPRPAVIQAALAKGINIYAICREEHTTLAAATGGNYYPSSQIEFYCYPPDHNNIIQALEDINDSNDHLNILQALEDINDMSDYLKILRALEDINDSNDTL
jgi:gamma-glutamyl-gamma-aminobutyrate hydrolase PuuD